MKVRELPGWLDVVRFGFPTAVGESVTDVVRELPGWLGMFGLELASKLDLTAEVRGPRECSWKVVRRAGVCTEWEGTERREQ